MDSVSDLISMMRRKGVRLWEDNGLLRCQAPPGALTVEEREMLKSMRSKLIAFLRSASSTEEEPQLLPRSRAELVGLTHSQRLFWNRLELDIHRSIRGFGVALHLSGNLGVEALRSSLSSLVKRHEALRTQIRIHDGVPRQCLSEANQDVLEVVDFTGSNNSEVSRYLGAVVAEPIDVAVDSLFEAKLLRLSDLDHVLLLAIDHLVTDAVSNSIILRDIWNEYEKIVLSLPGNCRPPPLQFADYALWQERTSQLSLRKHGEYWLRRLAGAERVQLFTNNRLIEGLKKGAELPIRFDKTLVDALRGFSKRAHTTLAMAVLTSYAAVVLRWCEKADFVLPYITDARPRAELADTVGFFAAPLHLRIRLLDGDTFVSFLSRVVSEFSNACEHHDFGRIAAQLPHPEFSGNPTMNWVPKEYFTNMALCGHVGGLEDSEYALRAERFEFESSSNEFDDVSWEYEGVFLVEAADAITGSIAYRAGPAQSSAVERFRQSWLSFAQVMSRAPSTRISTIPCVRE